MAQRPEVTMKEIYKNGCKTPAVIARELRQCGKLMYIKLAGDNKTEIFEFDGECFEVLSFKDNVIQVTRKDIETIRFLLAYNKYVLDSNELKFGGF